MKIPRPLVFALTLAGRSNDIVVVGLSWPSIFPAIVVVDILRCWTWLLTIIGFEYTASPVVWLWIVGSRIPREGGQTEQFIMAAIMGIIFSLPFACMVLWFFTGW